MDLQNLKTVCFALGPYRNLTTLTASLLALHPTCQVLNHGSDHILPNPNLNFLVDYSDAKFLAFVQYAVSLSVQGRRGRYGGSITLSHAFDDSNIAETYDSRFGGSRIKPVIETLFWKESLRVTRFIREHPVDLDCLLSGNSLLRFLMPVRNPVDCALSNMRSGHAGELVTGGPIVFDAVLDAVLREILWFVELRDRFPGRFFNFYEHDFDRESAAGLAEFLAVAPEDSWLDDVMKNYNIRKPYQYSDDMVMQYERLVRDYFSDYPEDRDMLLGFFGES